MSTYQDPFLYATADSISCNTTSCLFKNANCSGSVVDMQYDVNSTIPMVLGCYGPTYWRRVVGGQPDADSTPYGVNYQDPYMYATADSISCNATSCYFTNANCSGSVVDLRYDVNSSIRTILGCFGQDYTEIAFSSTVRNGASFSMGSPKGLLTVFLLLFIVLTHIVSP